MENVNDVIGEMNLLNVNDINSIRIVRVDKITGAVCENDKKLKQTNLTIRHDNLCSI